MNILQTRNLTKYYGKEPLLVKALDGINMEIEQGSFTAIVGRSGSGKSTLLHMLGGLDCPTGGSVMVDGQELSGLDSNELTIFRRRKIGFVFQNFNLMPNLNIYDNVILPGYMAKKRKHKEINAYADELLRKFQITSIAGHSIQEVSGGELQRACIARAMINQPQILFADEPTGALNSSNAKEVMDMFLKVHEQGTTILMVTHDVKVASYAQRICYINDGKIESNLDIGMLKHADELKEREKKVYNWLVEKGW